MDDTQGWLVLALGWVGVGALGGFLLGLPKGRARGGALLGVIFGPAAWLLHSLVGCGPAAKPAIRFRD